MPTNRMARVAALLTLIVVIAYAAPLLGGATFVGRDHLTGTIPAKQAIADALRSGHLPEWWDAIDLGVPLAANPAHSVLYPPTWIVAILPMPFGVDVLQILHVLLAGLGAAMLARRLGADTWGSVLAGSAFMLGGFTSSTLIHGVPLVTLSWLPWVAWAADRVGERTTVRRTLALAAVMAAELLAGDPSFALIGGWLGIGFALARADKKPRAFAAVVAAYVAAVLLAAVSLVPAMHLATDSARSSGISTDVATEWSMHPLRLLELVWPQVFGDPNQVTQHLSRQVADASVSTSLSPSWAIGVYISLPVVILAVIGLLRAERKRWLIAFIALFFLIALGRYTPVYSLYRLVFLPERLVRYPEKYLVGILVCISALAGAGWTAVVSQPITRRTRIAIGGALGGFAVLVVVAAAAGRALVGNASSLSPDLDVDAGLALGVRGGVMALVVCALIVGTFVLTRRRPQLRPIAAGILIIHLVMMTWQLLPLFDRGIIERPPQILAGVEPGHRLARTLTHLTRPDDPLPVQARTLYEGAAANMATRFGFGYLIGYDQGYNARFAAWEPIFAHSGERAIDLYGADLAIVVADRAGRSEILGNDAPYGPNVLVRNAGARPRAFVAPSVRYYADDASLAAALFPPGERRIDARTLATAHVLGRGTDVVSDAAIVPCTVTSPRPERVRVECDSPVAGHAMLLDSYARGWTATLDGKPTPIEQADALVRAVPVTAGHHVIEYRYSTPGLATGALVSLVSWLSLLGVYFGVARTRRPTDSGPARPLAPAIDE